MSRRRTKVTGIGRLVRKFREVTEKVCRKANRGGVDEAAKRILKDARANVRVDTKLLKKSLGKKIKTYKKKLVVVGIVGPRKQMQGKKGSRTRTEKYRQRVGTDRKGQAIYQDPVKYAHLVEFGTKPHALGRGSRKAREGRKHAEVQTGRRHPGSKAYPFLRPALDRNRSVSKALVARTLAAAIKRIRRK